MPTLQTTGSISAFLYGKPSWEVLCSIVNSVADCYVFGYLGKFNLKGQLLKTVVTLALKFSYLDLSVNKIIILVQTLIPLLENKT